MKKHQDHTFSNESFEKGNIKETTFLRCHFPLVTFSQCRLSDVQFIECKFTGVNFSQVDPFLLSMDFRECLLINCNFSGLVLKKRSFERCTIKECDFVETNLEGASFRDARLPETRFHHCTLSGADFRGATEYLIDPSTNKVKKAKFSLPEALQLLKVLDITVE